MAMTMTTMIDDKDDNDDDDDNAKCSMATAADGGR